jgi:magnesium-transporting ATPase (P-type)
LFEKWNVRFTGMCADLGQIKYVLSDKTGTLTKNLMVVQHFSIADRVFGDPISMGGEEGDASFTSTGALLCAAFVVLLLLADRSCRGYQSTLRRTIVSLEPPMSTAIPSIIPADVHFPPSYASQA